MKLKEPTHSNKYIVQRSFKDKEVVLSGDDPLQLHTDAIKLGIKYPIIFYVSNEPRVFGDGTYEG